MESSSNSNLPTNATIPSPPNATIATNISTLISPIIQNQSNNRHIATNQRTTTQTSAIQITLNQPTSFPQETANSNRNQISENTDNRNTGKYCYSDSDFQINLQSNKDEEDDLQQTIDSQQINSLTQPSPNQTTATNTPTSVALPNEPPNYSQQWPTQLQPNSIITSSEGATLPQPPNPF
jgi:hypothetical protein